MKNFKIEIPSLLGAIWLKINGEKSFYLTTDGESNYSSATEAERENLMLHVRLIPYSLNMHVGLHPDGVIEARCWHDNGNDQLWASEAKSDYQRTNAMYGNRKDVSSFFKAHFEMSLPAKKKLQIEVLKAVNAFYIANKKEIVAAWAERGKLDAIGKVAKLKTDLQKTYETVENLRSEIQQIEKTYLPK